MFMFIVITKSPTLRFLGQPACRLEISYRNFYWKFFCAVDTFWLENLTYRRKSIFLKILGYQWWGPGNTAWDLSRGLGRKVRYYFFSGRVRWSGIARKLSRVVELWCIAQCSCVSIELCSLTSDHTNHYRFISYATTNWLW